MKPNRNERYDKTKQFKTKKTNEELTSRSFRKTKTQLSNSKEKFPNIYQNTMNNQNSTKNYYSKKFSIQHPFWEREQLFDKCIKLQTDLNNLNAQCRMTKIENHHQSEMIKKQDNLLKKYSVQFEEKKDNLKDKKTLNENSNNEEFKKSNKDINEGEEIDNEENYEENENKTQTKVKKKMNRKEVLKSLTDEERKQIAKEENEKNNKEKDDNLKLLSLPLIKNLKMRCKQLTKENKDLDNKIKENKKDFSYSKVVELEREKQIYSDEMDFIKSQLDEALEKIKNYEEKDTNIKKLMEDSKKQDKKITVLIKVNDRNMGQSEKRIKELERLLDERAKKIKRLKKDLNLNKETLFICS